MGGTLLSCCNLLLRENKEGECFAEIILERGYTSEIKTLSSLGRLEEILAFNASLSTRCWKMLNVLIPEIEFNIKKAIHVTDNPLTIKKLQLYLERTSVLEFKELCFTKCGILIPCELCNVYPFSQIECPKPLPRPVREIFREHNLKMLKRATCSVTPCMWS